MTPLSMAQARVLMALVAVHSRDGRATVRSVQEVAGHGSPSTTHALLCELRDAGWVAWEPGKSGSLRPLARWERVEAA